jgi:hypothetical protein
MSLGEIAYLSLVVIAALIFIMPLAWESWRNP